jgi:hypothetical protein
VGFFSVWSNILDSDEKITNRLKVVGYVAFGGTCAGASRAAQGGRAFGCGLPVHHALDRRWLRSRW